MSDSFEAYASGLASPAKFAVAVSPNDSTDLSTFSRGLYVGGDGDVSVIMVGGGSAVTFAGVLAGTILPIRVSRVRDTDTTATNIVALY
jgi:hypothetical protein